MKAQHSTAWVASAQRRKQRKYRYNAPQHIKGSFMIAPLSKDLATKHGVKRIRVRVGDKVRVLRGQFKSREGKVERVDIKNTKVFIAKVELVKKDGATKVPYPINPSNVMIVELDTGDKRRAAKLKSKKEKGE
jgi:large subunit ribosomal protein L24